MGYNDVALYSSEVLDEVPNIPDIYTRLCGRSQPRSLNNRALSLRVYRRHILDRMFHHSSDSKRRLVVHESRILHNNDSEKWILQQIQMYVCV
jgi:hypothetical protein